MCWGNLFKNQFPWTYTDDSSISERNRPAWCFKFFFQHHTTKCLKTPLDKISVLHYPSIVKRRARPSSLKLRLLIWVPSTYNAPLFQGNHNFIRNSFDTMNSAWIVNLATFFQRSVKEESKVWEKWTCSPVLRVYFGSKNVLDQLFPPVPLSHPQSCRSSLVQVACLKNIVQLW